MEKAQRARRAQKGERRKEGGDPLEDEEIYPHYDIDGNDEVIMSHRGEGMTGHSTVNESLYRYTHFNNTYPIMTFNLTLLYCISNHFLDLLLPLTSSFCLLSTTNPWIHIS